eukprot:s376_g30.t1
MLPKIWTANLNPSTYFLSELNPADFLSTGAVQLIATMSHIMTVGLLYLAEKVGSLVCHAIAKWGEDKIAKNIVQPLEHDFVQRVRGTNFDKEFDETNSPRCQGVGKAACDEQSREALLRGCAIKEELFDTNLNKYVKLEETVTDCTEKIKNEIKTSPILVVGLTGHGKSELIGKLLDKIPGRRCAEQKPKIGSPGCGSVTKAVETFSTTVEGWTTEGLVEEVIFADGPGWNLSLPVKDVKRRLLSPMKQKAMEDASNAVGEQLVVLLAIKAEDVVTLLEDQRFLNFLAGLFFQKLALVAVLTNSERCSEEHLDIAKANLQTHLESLSKEYGECVTVHEVMSWTNKSDAATEEIYKCLSKACRGQLESSSFRRKIVASIESELEQKLRAWSTKGDSPNVLARRYVWVCARHRGLRIKGLQLAEDRPWEDAVKVVNQLKNQSSMDQLEDAEDGWHTDELRTLELQTVGCRSPLSLSISSVHLWNFLQKAREIVGPKTSLFHLWPLFLLLIYFQRVVLKALLRILDKPKVGH